MSKLFKLVAFLTAIVGSIALVGAWIAGKGGVFMGFDWDRLYIDATNLLLASIAFGVLSIGKDKKRKKIK